MNTALPRCRYRLNVAADGSFVCGSSCVNVLDVSDVQRVCRACPLPDKDCSRDLTTSAAASLAASGPGRELLAILSRLGVPSCQQCHDLARQMDDWGPAGCTLRLGEIAADILPRAEVWAQRGWLTRWFPRWVLRIGIGGLVKAAIRAAEH